MTARIPPVSLFTIDIKERPGADWRQFLSKPLPQLEVEAKLAAFQASDRKQGWGPFEYRIRNMRLPFTY
jgi:hypothetical protein